MTRKIGTTRGTSPRINDGHDLKGAQKQPPLFRDYEISYSTCVAIFVIVLVGISITPLKEYYVGSYVTKSIDEVRDEVVARKLNNLGVVISGVHYFDTFDREDLPLIDLNSKKALTRTDAATLSLSDFLVRANLRRSDLLASLPRDILITPVNVMEDVYAPLCGPVSASLCSWETDPQLLFGNWFPLIRHEFCRDFHAKFPSDRFFNYRDKTPIDEHLKGVGNVTLGLIAVVNMSEIYLRHFEDVLVVRKIMKNVQEGFMASELPEYTDSVADAIVELYSEGISLADVVRLLPGSFDTEHIALADVLGVNALLTYYLDPQQLSVGVNVNGEAAIFAEVTHATASFLTPDFLIDSVGMHLISTMHLAPFWNCAIQYTTMNKSITSADVNGAAMKQCGTKMTAIIPTFTVNLMFLFQKRQRDYSELDNTTTYTLGRRRESALDYTALKIPEVLSDSAQLSMDGTRWSKSHSNITASTSITQSSTPYGYLYTPDCQAIVDIVMQQSGRNVQKYQAYIGDGLGSCSFRDSQETNLQTLCRLFMTSEEVLFRTLNGSLVELPSCSSFISDNITKGTLDPELHNLRQIEWFMIDTTMLTRRIRIQDNTSRQIRTFLLILNLIGASHYAIEYIVILKSVWLFIRNSVYQPTSEARSQSRIGSTEIFKRTAPLVHIGIFELLQCDPADGALGHPGTMVLLYLGAIGALSNIFSLSCTAQLSTEEGSIAIYCLPAIPMRSFTLVLTTLSSSYWVIRVTLQTRSLAIRLDHAARNDFVRFWSLNAAAVLVIHFSCKAGADLVFRNAEMHSDPHLYAICGGTIVAIIISIGFLFVHVVSNGTPRIRSVLKQRSTGVLWQEPSVRDASGRAFVAKWSTRNLDSVLYHCASPQIARQLEAFGNRQHISSFLVKKLQTVVTTSGSQPIGIRMHHFVAVHCAAGAHAHLQTVKWFLEPSENGGVTSVNPTPRTARVIPTEMHRFSRDSHLWARSHVMNEEVLTQKL
ncbi:unnamed protein product [Phytophthora fragariaefolia]|uniref:Unnamed protein product n=1 Tax=Phytophthora fragariaefolia TaxID=1490495 RepID=A0A9W6Y032_9STRA|nr:unnamed protein product [Phytophthora fragariaefolia]